MEQKRSASFRRANSFRGGGTVVPPIQQQHQPQYDTNTMLSTTTLPLLPTAAMEMEFLCCCFPPLALIKMRQEVDEEMAKIMGNTVHNNNNTHTLPMSRQTSLANLKGKQQQNFSSKSKPHAFVASSSHLDKGPSSALDRAQQQYLRSKLLADKLHAQRPFFAPRRLTNAELCMARQAWEQVAIVGAKEGTISEDKSLVTSEKSAMGAHYGGGGGGGAAAAKNGGGGDTDPNGGGANGNGRAPAVDYSAYPINSIPSEQIGKPLTSPERLYEVLGFLHIQLKDVLRPYLPMILTALASNESAGGGGARKEDGGGSKTVAGNSNGSSCSKKKARIHIADGDDGNEISAVDNSIDGGAEDVQIITDVSAILPLGGGGGASKQQQLLNTTSKQQQQQPLRMFFVQFVTFLEGIKQFTHVYEAKCTEMEEQYVLNELMKQQQQFAYGIGVSGNGAAPLSPKHNSLSPLSTTRRQPLSSPHSVLDSPATANQRMLREKAIADNAHNEEAAAVDPVAEWGVDTDELMGAFMALEDEMDTLTRHQSGGGGGSLGSLGSFRRGGPSSLPQSARGAVNRSNYFPSSASAQLSVSSLPNAISPGVAAAMRNGGVKASVLERFANRFGIPCEAILPLQLLEEVEEIEVEVEVWESEDGTYTIPEDGEFIDSGDEGDDGSSSVAEHHRGKHSNAAGGGGGPATTVTSLNATATVGGGALGATAGLLDLTSKKKRTVMVKKRRRIRKRTDGEDGAASAANVNGPAVGNILLSSLDGTVSGATPIDDGRGTPLLKSPKGTHATAVNGGDSAASVTTPPSSTAAAPTRMMALSPQHRHKIVTLKALSKTVATHQQNSTLLQRPSLLHNESMSGCVGGLSPSKLGATTAQQQLSPLRSGKFVATSSPNNNASHFTMSAGVGGGGSSSPARATTSMGLNRSVLLASTQLHQTSRAATPTTTLAMRMRGQSPLVTSLHHPAGATTTMLNNVSSTSPSRGGTYGGGLPPPSSPSSRSQQQQPRSNSTFIVSKYNTEGAEEDAINHTRIAKDVAGGRAIGFADGDSDYDDDEGGGLFDMMIDDDSYLDEYHYNGDNNFGGKVTEYDSVEDPSAAANNTSSPHHQQLQQGGGSSTATSHVVGLIRQPVPEYFTRAQKTSQFSTYQELPATVQQYRDREQRREMAIEEEKRQILEQQKREERIANPFYRGDKSVLTVEGQKRLKEQKQREDERREFSRLTQSRQALHGMQHAVESKNSQALLQNAASLLKAKLPKLNSTRE